MCTSNGVSASKDNVVIEGPNVPLHIDVWGSGDTALHIPKLGIYIDT